MRGGLGGGGLLESMAKLARGGGGRGPAVACKPCSRFNQVQVQQPRSYLAGNEDRKRQRACL